MVKPDFLQNKELYILTMGTKSKSWWLDHGIGCRVNNESWVDEASSDSGRAIPPEEFVEGCILEYYYVEVIHAGIQCVFAVSHGGQLNNFDLANKNIGNIRTSQ